MEKTFKETKFTFKEKPNMRDFSKISETSKEMQTWSINEFDMMFKIFPILCESIEKDWKKIVEFEQKRKYIEELTDLEEFTEITEVIAKIMIDLQQKKNGKKNLDIKSASQKQADQ